MTDATVLGRNLKSARGRFRRTDSPRQGISQDELSDRAGVGIDAIGAIERGETLSPNPGTLESLAEVLGTTAEVLLGENME